MNIDAVALDRLAKLGGIKLEDEKIETTKNHLSEIINFMENINTLNLGDIPASFNPLNSKLPMRQDIVEPKPEIAKSILKQAPHAKKNFFIVPKIID